MIRPCALKGRLAAPDDGQPVTLRQPATEAETVGEGMLGRRQFFLFGGNGKVSVHDQFRSDDLAKFLGRRCFVAGPPHAEEVA